MNRSLIIEASKVVPDPHVLINLISKRVKQLNLGRSPLIQAPPMLGAADIALTELIEGKLEYLESTSPSP